MAIKKIYKTHIINKITKNKWQSIKHVTSNKYTQSHMHYTGPFDTYIIWLPVL